MQREHHDRIARDVQTMGGDIVRIINHYGLDSEALRDAFVYQTAVRQLNRNGNSDSRSGWHGAQPPCRGQFRQPAAERRAFPPPSSRNAGG